MSSTRRIFVVFNLLFRFSKLWSFMELFRNVGNISISNMFRIEMINILASRRATLVYFQLELWVTVSDPEISAEFSQKPTPPSCNLYKHLLRCFCTAGERTWCLSSLSDSFEPPSWQPIRLSSKSSLNSLLCRV